MHQGRGRRGELWVPLASSVQAEQAHSGQLPVVCELSAGFTPSILAWCLICSPLIEQMCCRQRGWAGSDLIRGAHRYSSVCSGA